MKPDATNDAKNPAYTVDPYVGKPYGYEHRLPESPNGRDPFRGMPWMVRAVAILGVPAIIALGAVWWGANVIGGTVAENYTRLTTMAGADALHDQLVRTQLEELRRQGATQTRLLRSICQSVAKTDVQRDKCSE